MKKKAVSNDYRFTHIRFKKEEWHRISLEAHNQHLKTSTWIKKKVLDLFNGIKTWDELPKSKQESLKQKAKDLIKGREGRNR